MHSNDVTWKSGIAPMIGSGAVHVSAGIQVSPGQLLGNPPGNQPKNFEMTDKGG